MPINPLGMQAQAAFTNRWGVPANAAIKLREQGKAPPVPGAPAQAQGSVPEAKPSMQPAQAGLTNAAQPGFFNGNPGIGIPKAEAGFTPQPGSRPGTPPTPPGTPPTPPGTPPTPPGTPPTPPGTPLPPGIGAAPGAPPPGMGRFGQQIRQAMGGAMPPVPQMMPQAPAPPAPPVPPTGTPLPPVTAQPIAPPPGPPAPPAPPPSALPPGMNQLYGGGGETAAKAAVTAPATDAKPWQSDDRSFKEQFGQARPNAWDSWDQERRQQWKSNHYQPAGGAAEAPPPPGGGGVTPPPPGTPPETPPPAPPPEQQQQQAPADGSAGSFDQSGYYGKHGKQIAWDDPKASWESFQNAGGSYADWVANSNAPAQGYYAENKINKPGSIQGPAPTVSDYAGQPVTVPPRTDVTGLNQFITDPFLRGIAMDMHDAGQEIARLAESGVAVGDNQILKLQERIDSGMAALSPYGIAYNPTEGINYAGGGGPGNTPPGHDDQRDDLNAGDTDIRTQFDFSAIAGNLKQALNRIGIDSSKLSPAALMEFATQTGLLENAWQNQQKAININQGTLDATLAENNPLRRASEAGALEALNNPDPTDWNAVMNRYAADSAKGTSQAYDTLNQNASQLGLGSGDVAGFGAQLGADSSNALARGISELEHKQALAGRAGLFDAMSMAGNVDQNYRGSESMARQILANTVNSTPQAAANPYSGVANTATNMAAIQQAYDAQREAERGNGLAGGLGGLMSGAELGSMFGPWGAAIGGALGGAGGYAANR